MMSKYAQFFVTRGDTILSALKMMDSLGRKLLIIMAGDQFEGLISIGDIQRAIIKGVNLNDPISSITRKDIVVAKVGDNIELVKKHMREHRNELMPVVTETNELVKVIFWEDLFKEERLPMCEVNLNLPVVIMAGGQGVRMKPLTNVLPKPLIPLNKKSIIEDIMDRFLSYGCSEFYISLNYKADLIRYYLDSLNNPNYNISYFQERSPLGTIGSLYLIKDKITSTFFVSNCDIVIDQDYNEVLQYHRANENEITIVAAMKNYPIPYGTISSGESGLLQTIEEKPEVVFKINTGFYILEPHLLQEIPDNQYYHITDLIESVQRDKRRVGVFPINDKSLLDIGNWTDYMRHINKQ